MPIYALAYRALRAGDWNLVSKGVNGPRELNDLKTHRGESHEMAAAQPQKVRAQAAPAFRASPRVNCELRAPRLPWTCAGWHSFKHRR